MAEKSVGLEMETETYKSQTIVDTKSFSECNASDVRNLVVTKVDVRYSIILLHKHSQIKIMNY